jgi:hypothetical protein
MEHPGQLSLKIVSLSVTIALGGFAFPVAAAPAADKKPTTPTAPTAQAAKPATPATPGKGAGELGEYDIKGQRKDRLPVGKFDPPAAFNLEDIQNFPEDRLQPVLNNPLTFNEGRDFSVMMDFQDEQLYHPWLPEIAKAPYLTMKTAVEKPSRDWTFSIIDQAGATVYKQDGKGNPPALLTWDGKDSVRDHVAVDTVYIPQLSTTDKDGYRHTYMGQPVQLSALTYQQSGKTVIELSTKRLFQDKKPDLSKEAPALLDKVCDVVREHAQLPFAIQPYDNDAELAQTRQQSLVKYFSEKLYIPEKQIVLSNLASPAKRGPSMAIVSNATPGGSDQ